MFDWSRVDLQVRDQKLIKSHPTQLPTFLDDKNTPSQQKSSILGSNNTPLFNKNAISFRYIR